MELMEAIKNRHSVRQYTDKPIPDDIIKTLEAEIASCNEKGNLHIQLVKNEPKAFSCFKARYGKFSGVTNYIALIGPKSANLDERCGYYGEHLALKAQQLGLNTCWVAMTYKKIPGVFAIDAGEKLTLVIALGYGENQGIAHKSKAPADVSNISGDSPDWFKAGVEAALYAPTAMNQQKFTFTCEGNQVFAKAGTGFYAKADLGIAKYHFEAAAGREQFQWGTR